MKILRQVTLSALFVGTLVAVAALGVCARDGWRAEGPASPREMTDEPPASAQPPSPTEVPTVRETEVRPTRSPSEPGPTVTATAFDEAALMQRLREMRQSDPELSLRLAREGNEQFPASPEAAERAAIVVKSLMRQGRAAEATAEARAMVDTYPGTPWAVDVKRHMLDIPSYVPDPSVP